MEWARTHTDPMDRIYAPSGYALYSLLDDYGIKPPEWLKEEIRDADLVTSKGTRAAVIWKAMWMDWMKSQGKEAEVAALLASGKL